jgi:hypothetical protein
MLKEMKRALRLVFKDKRYALLAAGASAAIAVLYLFAGQVIAFFPEGVYFEQNLSKLGSVAVLSALFGIVIAMQVYFLKQSAVRAKESGMAFGGTVSGLFAMSCCAPVLPSVFVLAGFSGTALLSMTAFFGKYFLQLVLLSAGLLIASVIMLSKNITGVCKV